jgi:RNA polymerase sigma-70 factor, ECF subfamily
MEGTKMTPSTKEITQLLLAWSKGDQAALEQLTPLVYSELHRLARGYMLGERPGHTLQTTELINEVFVRLIDWQNVSWQNRTHFFSVAAKMMRRVLVDFARKRNYVKRGGGAEQISIDEAAILHWDYSAEFIALDNALKRLAEFDQRKCLVVELRFFGGLTVEETAEVLKISPRTVMREWNTARAWLYRELRGKDEAGTMATN